MKIHTGDTVLIIAGKDKGKTGSVLRVLEEDNRVVVGGINIRTRHVKKTYQQAGRIVKYEASISASNVMILDPKTGKPSRIGYKVDDKGRKIRVSKVSGEEVKAVKPKKEPKKAEKTTAAKTKKDPKQSDEVRTEETADGKKANVPVAKKSPFWKRMGMSSSAETADTNEPAHSQQDHSIPGQQLHVRKGGRGS
jgi:large subunit ribosomal protein L24